MEWLSQLVASVAKLAPAPLLAVGIATGTILFVSHNLAATLGVDEFRAQYRGAIGGAFIFALSYLVANTIWWLKQKGAAWISDRNARLVRERRLHELTPEERGFLQPFILENKNTLLFPMEDGIVGGLLRKAIVYQSSLVIDMIDGVPYNLQPWARTYLVEHPDLLAGAAPIKERVGLSG